MALFRIVLPWWNKKAKPFKIYFIFVFDFSTDHASSYFPFLGMVVPLPCPCHATELQRTFYRTLPHPLVSVSPDIPNHLGMWRASQSPLPQVSLPRTLDLVQGVEECWGEKRTVRIKCQEPCVTDSAGQNLGELRTFALQMVHMIIWTENGAWNGSKQWFGLWFQILENSKGKEKNKCLKMAFWELQLRNRLAHGTYKNGFLYK